MGEVQLEACDVLGVRCVIGAVETAADAVACRAASGAGGFSVLCNVHVLMTAQKDHSVMDAVTHAWAVFPDGAPVAWLQRRAGHRRAARIGGPDLMSAVMDRGRAQGLRHMLLGSTDDVLAALGSALRQRFAGLAIVASVAPAPGAEDGDAVVQAIRHARPHIVWVALGAPKQELWMRRVAREIDSALLMGVGAAFDFHAGTKKRAPRWLQRAGLEWLHRLSTEPRRLVRRYAVTNLAFAMHASRLLIRHASARRA